MTYLEAVATLDKIRQLDMFGQQARAQEIAEAFRIFWVGAPSEDEFAEHLSRLLITPRTMYIALTVPRTGIRRGP